MGGGCFGTPEHPTKTKATNTTRLWDILLGKRLKRVLTPMIYAEIGTFIGNIVGHFRSGREFL